MFLHACVLLVCVNGNRHMSNVSLSFFPLLAVHVMDESLVCSALYPFLSHTHTFTVLFLLFYNWLMVIRGRVCFTAEVAVRGAEKPTRLCGVIEAGNGRSFTLQYFSIFCMFS